MALLGIKTGNYSGLYYFKSYSMAELVSSYFDSMCFGDSVEKEALKLFGKSKDDIIDGILLIRYVRSLQPKNSDGASGHTKLVSYTELVKMGIIEGDKNNVVVKTIPVESKTVSKSSKTGVLSKSATKSVIKPVTDTVSVTPTSDVWGDFLRALDMISKKNDIAVLSLTTGVEYRLSLRNMFFVLENTKLENCLQTVDEEVKVNEEVLNKYVEQGKILRVGKSTISSVGSYLHLTSFDDGYSPELNNTENGKSAIVHHINDLYLNMTQIVSVAGLNSFPELYVEKISQPVVLKYLNSLTF